MLFIIVDVTATKLFVSVEITTKNNLYFTTFHMQFISDRNSNTNSLQTYTCLPRVQWHYILC